MSKITIEIETDNAAFDDERRGCSEVARILRIVGDKLCMGYFRWNDYEQLCDVNGNPVGFFNWEA
jgi:hypothetical protein